MNKLKKNDQVIILTGKDKGKRGTVSLRVDDSMLLVDGINVVKKHAKPNPMKGIEGGIITKSMPIHQSNVAIFNPKTSKADRVGIREVEVDGKSVKERFYKSTGDLIQA